MSATFNPEGMTGATFNPEMDDFELTPEQIEELLEDPVNRNDVQFRIYVGDLIRANDGILSSLTPVFEDDHNIYTPTNLIINKQEYDIDPATLLRVQEVMDMENEDEKRKSCIGLARMVDDASKYADADVYYLADDHRFCTPDGIDISAIAVYHGDLDSYCILRDVSNDFYIRQVDDDTRFDGMRECTYAEYNPWHKDISEAIKQKGPEKANVTQLKLEIIDRQLSGGKAGKYDVKETFNRPDQYEKLNNKELQSKIQEDKAKIELQNNREKEMIKNNNLRTSLMSKLQENKDKAEVNQQQTDAEKKAAEQSMLDRFLYGKRANHMS